MAGSRIYAHTLAGALRLSGSEKALAELLSVSPATLRRYLSGEVQPPDAVFLRAVDILFNHAFAGAATERRLVRYDAKLRQQARTSGRLQATVRLVGESQKAVQAAQAMRAEAAATRISHRPAFTHRLFDPQYHPTDQQDIVQTGLDAALQAASTDLGNVQLADADGALHIAAWRGFADEFRQLLDLVGEASTTCRLALVERRQVVISDVTNDALFAGTPELEVLLAADVRALCSTPLVTEGGAVLGMVSTHFHEPKVPDEEALAALDLVARGTAAGLESLAAAKI